ncbi:MAG TPA: efflux RND transporter periplasmic adaptor subunit [Thermoanaerobaculia bacterium]|nr:efflux RND transporter periplasmic adaptor subunit [Thermoanaerobaculia bacterium]
MKRTTMIGAIALAAAVVVTLALWRSGGDGAAAGSGGPPMGRGGGGPTVVSVGEVVRGDFTPETVYVGTLQADTSADIAVRSAGPLVEVSAEVGQRVRRGQVLARIDAADERERIAQARANLAMAEATLDQRRAALGIAQTTAERTRALFEQSLVPHQQLDAIDAEVAGARAQVAVAEAQVAQARAALSAGQVALEQTLIVAPFSGVVGRRYLDLGSYASQNDPVFQIADLSTIRVTVALPERQAALVEPGLPATLTLRSLPGETFRGQVARLSDILDPRSNTAEAQVEVSNPGGRLKPGMFAQVTISLPGQAEALLVPDAAVVEEEGRLWVYVVEEGRNVAGTTPGASPAAGPPGEEGSTLIARRRPVEVLGRSDGRRAVAGPLTAGERVITLGHEGIADGAAIRLEGALPVREAETRGEVPRAAARGEVRS